LETFYFFPIVFGLRICPLSRTLARENFLSCTWPATFGVLPCEDSRQFYSDFAVLTLYRDCLVTIGAALKYTIAHFFIFDSVLAVFPFGAVFPVWLLGFLFYTLTPPLRCSAPHAVYLGCSFGAVWYRCDFRVLLASVGSCGGFFIQFSGIGRSLLVCWPEMLAFGRFDWRAYLW